MGLYELSCFSSFSGFGIKIISATFHWEGKCLVIKMALNIMVSKNAFGGSSVRTFYVNEILTKRFLRI